MLHRAALPVRHRHGRRVGPRRLAGDGEDPGRESAASSPASCSRAIRWATCSPPSPSSSSRRSPAGAGCSSSARCPALLALWIRLRVERVRGLGGRPRSASARRRSASARSCCSRAILRALRLPRAAHDRLQLHEPRHPGLLPDLPGGRLRRRGTRRSRSSRSSTTSARSSAACTSARCRSASGAAGRSSCAPRCALPVARCSPTRRRSALVTAGRLPHAALRAGRVGRHPRAPHRALARRDPRLLPRRDLPARQPAGGAEPAAADLAGRFALAVVRAARRHRARCWWRSSRSPRWARRPTAPASAPPRTTSASRSSTDRFTREPAPAGRAAADLDWRSPTASVRRSAMRTDERPACTHTRRAGDPPRRRGRPRDDLGPGLDDPHRFHRASRSRPPPRSRSTPRS